MNPVLIALACWLALASCAASAPPPAHATPPASQGAARPGAGPAGSSAAEPDSLARPDDVSTAAPLSPAECEALLDHFMAVAFAEHSAQVALELVPTAEQVARIRADLAREFLPACLTMDRSTYDCERKAQTRTAMLECSGQQAP